MAFSSGLAGHNLSDGCFQETDGHHEKPCQRYWVGCCALNQRLVARTSRVTADGIGVDFGETDGHHDHALVNFEPLVVHGEIP